MTAVETVVGTKRYRSPVRSPDASAQPSRGQSRATPLLGSSRGATPCAFTFASDNDRQSAGNTLKIASQNRPFLTLQLYGNRSFEITSELKVELRYVAQIDSSIINRNSGLKI